MIIYDDGRTLRPAVFSGYWTTQPAVAILNGGFPKWTAENRAVTKAASKLEPAKFTAQPQ